MKLDFNTRLALAPILGGIIAKDNGGVTKEEQIEEALEYWHLLCERNVSDEVDA